MSHPIIQRIKQLRSVMAHENIDAYVVYHVDPHLSEYLPDYWLIRPWLSGFTGSAGHLIVTQKEAIVWTDGRYWSQAETELKGSGVELMRLGAPGVPDMNTWLTTQLNQGQRVGADGRVVSLKEATALKLALDSKKIALDLNKDLVSALWTDRPELPANKIFEFKAPYATRTRATNLSDIRAQMKKHNAQWHLQSSLDDIAWTLNLRGSDVSFNPVFLSYLLIAQDKATLFVDDKKLDADLIATLANDHIHIEPYTAISAQLACLPESDVLLIDPARTTVAAVNAAAFVSIVQAPNPSVLLKSLKTPAELANVRQVMEQDGAALCEFFAWFEQAKENDEAIDELLIDEKISGARMKRPNFVSLSFNTIAGFNGNGAMPHYRATEESYAHIKGDGLLLIDSGGQYLGGTTDITRVVPVGTVSSAQKSDYTFVLKAMIGLSCAVFPEGTPSPALDMIARLPLWQQGLDYGHGTGHGVGYFMNVHEGPQVIACRALGLNSTAMQVGMITSNEPGLYRENQWGVRIENLVVCVPDQQTEFGSFLKFETLTLCPIDTRCIDLLLLSPNEITWLNDYHATVKKRLLPYVDGAAKEWLIERTKPLIDLN